MATGSREMASSEINQRPQEVVSSEYEDFVVETPHKGGEFVDIPGEDYTDFTGDQEPPVGQQEVKGLLDTISSNVSNASPDRDWETKSSYSEETTS